MSLGQNRLILQLIYVFVSILLLLLAIIFPSCFDPKWSKGGFGSPFSIVILPSKIFQTRINKRKLTSFFIENLSTYLGEGGENRTRVRKHFHSIFSERSFWFFVSLPSTPKSRLRYPLSCCSPMLPGFHIEFSCIFDAIPAGLQVNRRWRAVAKQPVRSLFYF